MNRLAGSTSPYLLAHLDDPVDWEPFDAKALERARALDRPLFVSIGYAACHWCHVMAEESFQDPEVAALLNERFVCVKVDREERPDLDAVYLEAVQAMTGGGGWPMSVFATPDGKPFFAGTYFPPVEGRGLPSFRRVLDAVADAWAMRRTELLESAEELSSAVAARLLPAPAPARPAGGSRPIARARSSASLDASRLDECLERAVAWLAARADPEHKGFGRAPKFPQPLLVDLLLRAQLAGVARAGNLALETLEALDSGGIHDQIGGGFHRYAVDREWQVPHFEKMCYDQALLLRAHLHAWQLTGDHRFLVVLRDVAEFLLGELRDPNGGLWSSRDADSGGGEGRYYLWTPAEVEASLDPAGREAFVRHYRLVAAGPGGAAVVALARRGEIDRSPDVDRVRRRLAAARRSRPAPTADRKVVTEWNAMAADALAEAALATGDSRYGRAALEILRPLLDAARAGSLSRSTLDGEAGPPAFAPDYAWLAEASTRAAELTGDGAYLREAERLLDELVDRFLERDRGVLSLTPLADEPLVARPYEAEDGVTPSATSVAVLATSRLAALTGVERHRELGLRLLGALADLVERAPQAFPELLWGAELAVRGPLEVAVTGERPDLLAAAARPFAPRRVLRWGGLLAAGDRLAPTGSAVVCRDGTCHPPTFEADVLEQLVRRSAAA